MNGTSAVNMFMAENCTKKECGIIPHSFYILDLNISGFIMMVS
jgi:hypothetical protein